MTIDDAIPRLAASAGAVLIGSDMLDDLEEVRIRTENRLRSLTDAEHGKGLPTDCREAVFLASMVDSLNALEHSAKLQLQRAMRAHPLGAWVKRTVGIGEKQGARLLAALDDPYWNGLHDRPRTVSELWAYCGLHVIHPPRDNQAHPDDVGTGARPDQVRRETQVASVGVAPTRKRGQKENWNGIARKRVWLIAESCMKKSHSPYRPVYEAGRAKYADAVHPAPCARCGPSGHPAAAGSPLSAGHQHARALRLVSKAILRDLWVESKRLHEQAQ